MCRTQLSSTTVTLLWKEVYTNGTPERVPFCSSRGIFKFIALFQTARIDEGPRWKSAEIALLALGTELSPLSRLCEPESLSVEMELFTLRLCSKLPSMPAVRSSRELSVIRVDQHRPHHPLKSSPFSLIRSCCCGASRRFHPPGEQSSLCFDRPMVRELMALVSVDFWSLHVDFAGCPQCRVHLAQKSELSSHQMARMCDLPVLPRTKNPRRGLMEWGSFSASPTELIDFRRDVPSSPLTPRLLCFDSLLPSHFFGRYAAVHLKWTYCSFGTGVLALRLPSLRTSSCCTSGASK